eukprot:365560-Chlamydomonas_euryale.AAC.9
MVPKRTLAAGTVSDDAAGQNNCHPATPAPPSVWLGWGTWTGRAGNLRGRQSPEGRSFGPAHGAFERGHLAHACEQACPPADASRRFRRGRCVMRLRRVDRGVCGVHTTPTWKCFRWEEATCNAYHSPAKDVWRRQDGTPALGRHDFVQTRLMSGPG